MQSGLSLNQKQIKDFTLLSEIRKKQLLKSKMKIKMQPFEVNFYGEFFLQKINLLHKKKLHKFRHFFIPSFIPYFIERFCLQKMSVDL